MLAAPRPGMGIQRAQSRLTEYKVITFGARSRQRSGECGSVSFDGVAASYLAIGWTVAGSVSDWKHGLNGVLEGIYWRELACNQLTRQGLLVVCQFKA